MKKIRSLNPIEYELIETLGEGGFSTVYKALKRDLQLKVAQITALKILKSQMNLEKWKDEFLSLSRVKAPNCVRLLGWDYFQGCPVLVLEWIEGVTLLKWLQDFKRQQSAVEFRDLQHLIDEITIQVHQGLQDIHAAGLVHGDLSPQNAMIDVQGRLQLLDFGLTNTKDHCFTAEFAAPEVLAGRFATAKSDLYSLGRLRDWLERQLGLPMSTTTQILLSEEPEKRSLHLIFEPRADERQKTQTDLAQTVRQSLRQRTSFFLQKTMQKGSSLLITVGLLFKRNKMRALATLSCLALTFSKGSAAPDLRPALVMIKTKEWYEIRVNQINYGYTPVEIELPSGASHHFEWSSRRKKGQRSLTLQPGQNMVIGDDFFK